MKKALLIIDVQNDYFEKGKMPLYFPEKALTNIKKLEKYFNENNFPIVYIQHLKEGQHVDFFERGTYGAQLHPNLDLQPTSIIIKKIIITGMMTHMCIDSTTRASHELNYETIVISDAIATKELKFVTKMVPANIVQTSFLAALQTFASIYETDYYIH